MSKSFDMELFLAAVLTGSYATRQRHLRQAKIIQAEIAARWQRKTPWAWHRKHLAWFLKHRMGDRTEATRYYYVLTVHLLARRLGKTWVFDLRAGPDPDGQYRKPSAKSRYSQTPSNVSDSCPEYRAG